MNWKHEQNQLQTTGSAAVLVHVQKTLLQILISHIIRIINLF